MIITVFGSSLADPASLAYQGALRLGKSIAELGYTVMNGGYVGTMEAVSRGAAEMGGKVIGVTCDEIEIWRPVKPNRWLSKEIRFQTLQERLNYLACKCDQAIALLGGIGTLTEIAYSWNLMVVGVLDTPPLWIVGQEWQTVFQVFMNQLESQVPSNQRELVQFFANIDEVIGRLRGTAAPPVSVQNKKGPK